LNEEATQAYLKYAAQANQNAVNYVQACESAYLKYVQTLQNSNAQLQQFLAAAYNAYLEGLGRAWGNTPSQESCRRDYEEYERALNKIVRPAGEEQLAAQREEYGKFASRYQSAMATGDWSKQGETAQEYLAALNRIWSRKDEMEQAARAAEAYINGLREVQAQGQAAAMKAYEGFVDALSSAWRQSRLTETVEQSLRDYSEELRAAWDRFRREDHEASERVVQQVRRAAEKHD
jgi:hypothetical protein